MSLFMDLNSSWLPVGSEMAVDDELFSNTTLSTLEGYDVSMSAQVNEYVTTHLSETEFDAVDYNMEFDNFTDRKSMIIGSSGSWLDEQHRFDSLPGSPEVGHVTNLQLQRYIVQLELVPGVVQFTDSTSPITPPIFSTGQQAVDYKHLQPVSPETFARENDFGIQALSDQTIATVPECESYADDVIDLLDQLTEKMDSDMYVDPADFEAFVSFPLHPVSLDDVESLLSSRVSSVDTLVSATSSSSLSSSTQETLLVTPFPSWSSSEENSSDGSDLPVAHVEKKRKKQDQNKTAALRYRQKKRSEHGTVMNECEELEKRNIELKTKVAEMTKEVEYLKGLIEEICAP